jgi:hypothetical protein
MRVRGAVEAQQRQVDLMNKLQVQHFKFRCCGSASGNRCLFDSGTVRSLFQLRPGSGMGKKTKIRIRDEDPGSYFRELRVNFLGLKYLKSLMWIRNLSDPGSGMEKFGSWIRDVIVYPGSATLLYFDFDLKRNKYFSLALFSNYRVPVRSKYLYQRDYILT